MASVGDLRRTGSISSSPENWPGLWLRVSIRPNGVNLRLLPDLRASGLLTLRPSGLRPSGLRPSGLRPSGLRPSGLRPSGLRPSGRRPSGLRPSGLRPSGLRPSGLRPSGLISVLSGGMSPVFRPSRAHRSKSIDMDCQVCARILFWESNWWDYFLSGQFRQTLRSILSHREHNRVGNIGCSQRRLRISSS